MNNLTIGEIARQDGAFWDMVIEQDGNAVGKRSAERYRRAITGKTT